MDKRSVILGSALLALAVVMGAFGAHALKARLDPEHLGQWKTAVEYHFYHGLGSLLIAGFGSQLNPRTLARIRWCFLIGVILFSGSLYLLSTKDLNGLGDIVPVLGPITPLGGLCFIAGWVLLLITALRSPSPNRP